MLFHPSKKHCLLCTETLTTQHTYDDLRQLLNRNASFAVQVGRGTPTSRVRKSLPGHHNIVVDHHVVIWGPLPRNFPRQVFL